MSSATLTPTLLRIELLRMLRNPWTLGFSLGMPPLLYLLFGAVPSYASAPLPHGNVAGLVLVTMAAYGSMVAATSVAGTVSEERALGWTRQLRLSGLPGGAYVALKLCGALAVSGVVVAVTFAVGAATGAELAGRAWMATFAVAWLTGASLFAAFGIALGYLFRSEAVLGVAGPLMALLAFLGGLFIPLDSVGEAMRAIAATTPMYGVRELVQAPVTGDPVGVAAIANVTAWFAVFTGVAIWRFRTAGGR